MATTKPTQRSTAAAKKPAAKQTPKPAAKQAPKPAQAKQKPAEQPSPAQQAPGIPYHYNIVFELKSGKRVSADGILTIDAPVLEQRQYDGIKLELAKHFKMEKTAKSATITVLTRMDTLNLVPMPVEGVKAA